MVYIAGSASNLFCNGVLESLSSFVDVKYWSQVSLVFSIGHSCKDIMSCKDSIISMTFFYSVTVSSIVAHDSNILKNICVCTSAHA